MLEGCRAKLLSRRPVAPVKRESCHGALARAGDPQLAQPIAAADGAQRLRAPGVELPKPRLGQERAESFALAAVGLSAFARAFAALRGQGRWLSWPDEP